MRSKAEHERRFGAPVGTPQNPDGSIVYDSTTQKQRGDRYEEQQRQGNAIRGEHPPGTSEGR